MDNMPKAPIRDFSIEHITDCVVYNIIALSEVGSNYKEVSVEVAKELLKRFESEVKMSKCPFGKEEEMNTYLEGYKPFKGVWKTINNVIRYKKDCEKCPNFKNCEEW